jgi:hypothetical protein
MASGPAKYGTGIHTRATTDTGQSATKLLLRENCAAAVVHDHDMHLAARNRTVEVRCVGGNWLACGAPCEKPEKNCQVPRARNHLLNSHACDVDPRQTGSHVGIALVGTDNDSARFRHGKIHTSYSSLCRKEFLAQVLSS